jgi:hypothetical protein
MKVLKFCQAISRVNIEPKTKVSEISSVSIIMVSDVYTSLSNRCFFLLVYYEVGGRSQTVRLPIRL